MVTMRVVFLGTPQFAVPAFHMLLEHSYDICGVFTQPDKPSGRGQKIQPGPVKALAQECGIPVFQPVRIRNEENRQIIEALQPDFIVVAAYGQILPGWMLRAARIAPVNIHASMLPRYRGAAPVAWPIIHGDTATGVTTMLMHEALDAGAILLQQEVPIAIHTTTGELTAELSEIGATLLIRTLEGLQKDTIRPVLQDDNRVSWAPRITKEMAEISWHKCALDIHNQIRGMNPWPVACASFRKAHLRIWRSLPAPGSTISGMAPGTFLGPSRAGIYMQCGEGTVLEVLEVQLPAKGKVTGREFANGARLSPGEMIFQSTGS
jgi:methionyl-tRNA formyltransferase